MRKSWLWTLCLIGGGCGDQQAEVGPSRVTTLFDMLEAAREGGQVAGMDAREFITPRGEAILPLSPPYRDTALAQNPDFDGINMLPGYADGKPVAYTVNTVWEHYGPDVWVQPMYILVTQWDELSPMQYAIEEPIFGVTEDSHFYAPYWQINFAVVPEGTKPGDLRDMSDVMNTASEIHVGGAYFAAFVPTGLEPAVPEGEANPLRPLTETPTGTVNVSTGWASGRRTAFLDYGPSRFRIETGWTWPFDMFVLSSLDDEGKMVPLGVPNIATGGAKFVNGRPAWGAFWHIRQAVVPKGSAVFIPSSFPLLREKFSGHDWVVVPEVSPDIEALPDVNDFVMRVATDGACFADAASFATCTWIDDVPYIEANIPANRLSISTMYMTGPFTYINGAEVP